jgi:hypothetical protein
MLLGNGLGKAPVLAADFDVGLGYSLTHDSNITQIPTAPIADQTQTVIGGLAYVEHTIDLHARLLAQAEWRRYVHDTFDPSTAYYVNGAMIWTISPQQLFWSVDDLAREVRVNPNVPDVPGNRVNTNSLGTGPDYTVRPTPTDAAAIGGRYGRFDTSGGASGDNERYSAYARWLRQLAAQQALSLNYEAARVYFPDPTVLYQRVSRGDLFGRFDSRIAATNLITADLGKTRVLREGGEEASGRLARLTLTRRVTPTSTVRLSLADQISDPYSDLIGDVISATAPTEGAPVTPYSGTILITSDMYRSKRGQISYTNVDGRVRYSLRGFARNVDFQQTASDQKERGGQADWNWQYSNEAQIYAYAAYLKRTFIDIAQEDRERNFTLGVTYRVSRNVSITTEGGRIERASSVAELSFVDNRALLLLGYSTGPLYTVRSRR